MARLPKKHTKNIFKYIQDIQDKHKIPSDHRPGLAQARGRAVPGGSVRGPGLGPGLGRAGVRFVFQLYLIYVGLFLNTIFGIFCVYV